MCGRYLFKLEADAELQNWLETIPTHQQTQLSLKDVYPSQRTLVFTNAMTPQVMSWGLPRYQAKGRVINARSEGVEDSPFFKHHLALRRVIVRADGFYEWDKEKAKHLVHDASQNPFYMAGLYNEQGCFSILTNEVRTDFIKLHDRVPLMIPPHLINEYLEKGDHLLDYFRSLKQNQLQWENQTMQQRLF